MTARRYGQYGTLVVLGIVIAGMGIGLVRSGSQLDDIRVGPFSTQDPSQGLPEGWQPVTLAAAYRQTEFTLVRSEQGVVVRAHSDSSASALGTRCHIDLTTHPILEWRWKINSIVEEGNIRVGPRDDCPACLLVTFDYKDLSLSRRLKLMAYRALGYDAVPTRSLVYTWANRPGPDSTFRDPHLAGMRKVVVQSGTTHVGTWQAERRNVLVDYRRIFGEEPPPVIGIGLKTDTQKSGGEVTAYYGDVVFRSAPADTSRRRTPISEKVVSALSMVEVHHAPIPQTDPPRS